MCFDDLVPQSFFQQFERSNWDNLIYVDAVDKEPPNAPKPLGNPVEMRCFVEVSHASNGIIRRSQAGFTTYLNNGPIDWFSEKQTTVEASTLGSEFVAMRQASNVVSHCGIC